MVREGMVSGEFDIKEHNMVKGVLELDDIRVREIATPRTEVTYLDINASQRSIRQTLRETAFSAYIVVNESIDNIIGVVLTKDLLTHLEIHDGYYNTAYEHTGYSTPEPP